MARQCTLVVDRRAVAINLIKIYGNVICEKSAISCERISHQALKYHFKVDKTLKKKKRRGFVSTLQ